MRWAVPALVLFLAGCAGKQPLVPPTNSGSGNASSVSNASMASAAEADPRRRASIRLELAASYFQAGRIDVALEEVNQALAADPSSADGYGLLALIYMRNQDWDQADASLRKAMSLRPQDGDLQHNYGWLLCQRKQYAQAQEWLDKALAQPGYLERPKTWMAKGLCLQSAGQLKASEEALFKAYEMDAGNPVVASNLANVLYVQGDVTRARFYIRRLNNSEQANAESLWLGIKVERAQGDQLAMEQLAGPLGRRFAEAREWLAYQRGAFNE
jgi:type IV pilus assembly protein PilF